MGSALLVLAVFVSYRSSIAGPFIWDDEDVVQANPAFRDRHGLNQIWTEIGAAPRYQPLAHTMLWAEWRKFRLDPAGYRRDSIILHGLAAVALWQVLRKLRMPGAFLAAGIWALHPLQIESVVWIGRRGDVLGGLLSCLAMLTYLRFEDARRPTGGIGPSEIRNPKSAMAWYLSALAFFAGALLSSAMTAALPAAILLVLWWKRGRIGWQAIWPTIPLFAMAVPMALLSAWTERNIAGAAGPEWNLGLPERLGIAARAVWFYAARLVIPFPLSIDYGRWNPAAVWPGLLGATGITVAVLALWRRRVRLGRGPLAAVLFFVIMLLPVLGLTDRIGMRYSFVADHLQYLAGIGLIALAAGAIVRAGRIACVLAVIILLPLLGLYTFRHTATYKDALTLWQYTLKRNPASWLACNQLGLLASNPGNGAAAQEYFLAGLLANADNDIAMVHLADHAIKQGDALTAESLLARAVRRRLSYPPGSAIHRSVAGPARMLGTLLAEQGRVDEARSAYEQALAADPADGIARDKLAMLRNRRAVLPTARP